MSSGGMDQGTTVGLPRNSTAPGMAGLGIGGGIYGNPFQVNQLSQPNAAGGGGMFGMSGVQNNTSMPEWMRPYISAMQQGAGMYPQPQNMLNQPPVGMQAGLGSLIPSYKSRI